MRFPWGERQPDPEAIEAEKHKKSYRLFDEAITIARESRGAYRSIDAYSSLATTCAVMKKKEYDEFLSYVFERFDREAYNDTKLVILYNLAEAEFIAKKNLEEVFEKIFAYCAQGNSIDFLDQRETVVDLVKLCVQNNETDKALKLYHHFKSTVERMKLTTSADVYRHLAVAAAHLGLHNDTALYLRRIEDLLDSSDPDDLHYDQPLQLLLRAELGQPISPSKELDFQQTDTADSGLHDELMRLMLVTKAVIISGDNREKSLHGLAECEVVLNKYAEESPPFVADLGRLELIRLIIRFGDVDRAYRLTEAITTPHTKAIALAEITTKQWQIEEYGNLPMPSRQQAPVPDANLPRPSEENQTSSYAEATKNLPPLSSFSKEEIAAAEEEWLTEQRRIINPNYDAERELDDHLDR